MEPCLDGDVVTALRSHQVAEVLYELFLEKHGMHRGLMLCIRDKEPPPKLLNLLLCAAIEEDHEKLVDFLLIGHKVSINKRFNTKSPLPLLVAAHRRKLELVKRLMFHHGANAQLNGRCSVYNTDSKAVTVFDIALEHDDIELFMVLCSAPNSSCRRKDVLHLACLNGAYQCTKYLLENTKADVNTPCKLKMKSEGLFETKCEEYTPLMYASLGSSAVVKLLLAHGASVNAITQAKGTALHVAVNFQLSRDFVETLKVLIEAGLYVNARDDRSCTALSLLLFHIGEPESWFRMQDGSCDSETYSDILFESIKLLLQYGAVEESEDPLSAQLILQLCLQGHLHSVLDLSYNAMHHLTRCLTLLRQVVRLALSLGVDADKVNCLAPVVPRPYITHSTFQQSEPGQGQYASLLDKYLFVLVHKDEVLKQIKNSDDTSYKHVVEELLQIFTACLLQGIHVNRVNGFLILLWEDFELFKVVVEVYLATLKQSDYNHFLDVLYTLVLSERSPSDDVSGILQYLQGLKVCRPLKAVCRVVINRSLLPNMSGVYNLGLPLHFIEYLQYKVI